MKKKKTEMKLRTEIAIRANDKDVVKETSSAKTYNND